MKTIEELVPKVETFIKLNWEKETLFGWYRENGVYAILSNYQVQNTKSSTSNIQRLYNVPTFEEIWKEIPKVILNERDFFITENVIGYKSCFDFILEIDYNLAETVSQVYIKLKERGLV